MFIINALVVVKYQCLLSYTALSCRIMISSTCDFSLRVAVVQPAAPASETAASDTIEDAEPEYANVSVEKPIRVSKLTDYFQRLYSTPNGFKKEFLVC